MVHFPPVRQSISLTSFRYAILTSGAFGRHYASGMTKTSTLKFNPDSLNTLFKPRSSSVRFQKLGYCQIGATLQIELVPCLVDNYAYIIYDPNSSQTGVVDPSAAEPVKNALKKMGRKLTHIFNTHHHWDHTGGNMDLKYFYAAKIVAPHADGIQNIDVPVGDGDTWMFGEHAMNVLDTPGHTRGHVSFYFPGSSAIFTGDTLFSIGCGRLLEGSASQMWNSLSKISSLPNNTKIYCGHEYTLSNAKFALRLEPNNKALLSYFEKIKALREKGLPTIPSTLEVEKEINPFLRPFSTELRETLSLPGNYSDVQVFAAARTAKDRS